MTLVVMFFIGGWATILRICKPIEFNWDKSIDGTCGDEDAANTGSAVINATLDVVIVGLPFPIVWKLQMATQKKVAISVTFLLGLT
jgi:hypothetical protein